MEVIACLRHVKVVVNSELLHEEEETAEENVHAVNFFLLFFLITFLT